MSIKIGLTGDYNATMKAAVYDNVPEGYEIVEAPTSSDLDKLQDVEFIINRKLKITAEDLEKMPHLKLIAKYAVGFDNIDIQTAAQKNIPVVNCKAFNANAVAEFTITLILTALRNVVPLHKSVVEKQWWQDKYTDFSYTLKGSTLGIVGLGSIGCRVAELANAFGAKVFYYDVFRRSPEAEDEMHITHLPFEELLSKVDIVTLHSPGTSDGSHLMNADTIGMMKPGALLVNCSRGQNVDEQALYDALVSGKLRGAALDVFENEPPVNSPILKLNNVVMTPHVAGSVHGLGAGMLKFLLKVIADFNQGNGIPKANIVNYRSLVAPEKVRTI